MSTTAPDFADLPTGARFVRYDRDLGAEVWESYSKTFVVERHGQKTRVLAVASKNGEDHDAD